MKIKTTLIQPVMKNEKIYILIYLFFANIASFAAEKNADRDSLQVYLSESDSVFCIDLVFDNVSCDTIIVLNIFRHHYLEWSITGGIWISTYQNQKYFRLRDYGYMEKYFSFSEKKALYLSPKTKTKFNINLKQYFDGVTNGELGVTFDINYTFIRYD
jgi:hypothetical protein